MAKFWVKGVLSGQFPRISYWSIHSYFFPYTSETSVGQAGWQTWRRRIRVVFACIWESRQRSSSFAGYQGVSTVFFRVTFILNHSKPCVAGKTLDSIRVNVVGHLMMPTKINCINPLILKISLVILLSGCYTICYLLVKRIWVYVKSAFSRCLFSAPFLAGKCIGYYREKLHSNPGDRALPIIVIRFKQWLWWLWLKHWK